MTLDVIAVEAFTKGRLDRDDPETARQLDAALTAARRYCGWHVTPVLSNADLTLDGPGGFTLILPTLQMSALSLASEDSVALDVADLSWSARGLVRKNNGTMWTTALGGITVRISHGYATAADFESAVLAAIDRGAFSQEATDAPRVIGPFQYSEPAGGTDAVWTGIERHVLDSCRLERQA